LKEVVKIGELIAVEKEKTPIEYREYVKEQDRNRTLIKGLTSFNLRRIKLLGKFDCFKKEENL